MSCVVDKVVLFDLESVRHVVVHSDASASSELVYMLSGCFKVCLS